MTAGPKLSDILPNLLDEKAPGVDGKDPVILTGAYLRAADVHMLPGDEKRVSSGHDFSLANGYGGYAILRRLSVSKPEDWYHMLWRPSAEFPASIGVCGYEESLDRLLYIFEVTRFGVALAKRGPKRNLAHLGNLVKLYQEGRLSTTMRISDVSSRVKSLPRSATLVEAINLMIVNHVRRVFVQDDSGNYISDRSLLDFLFSPARLQIARDSPEKWADSKLSEIKSKKAEVFGGETLDEAAEAMGDSPDDCLLSEDGKVITRWDLIMKPALAGKLVTS
ncbi:MAG TPA: hypothetical protein VFE91_03470 [Nitrososphaerales archaeon]|nr:hypothetical protein [Nitrososphaerales archaeon]